MHAVTLVPSMEVARVMTPSHSPREVRADRLLAVHFPCQTRFGPVQDTNALDGNTGSEPVPKGLASRDPPSLSRFIDHIPYIARHAVESVVDVSELRRQSLGLDRADRRSELTCLLVHKARARFVAPQVGEVNGLWPAPSVTIRRPGHCSSPC
jgi:hypothetical protein